MYNVTRLTPMPWGDAHYATSHIIREDLRDLTVFCLREYYDDPAYPRRYQNNFYLEIVGITDEAGEFWHNTGATRAPLRKLASFIENYDGLHMYQYGLEGFLTWQVNVNHDPIFNPCFSTRHGDTERELYCHGDPYYVEKIQYINKHLPTNVIILTPRMQREPRYFHAFDTPVVGCSDSIVVDIPTRGIDYDLSNYVIIRDDSTAPVSTDIIHQLDEIMLGPDEIERLRSVGVPI